jgi:methylated-DNA-protein-cysteine methyltransferase-like protein
MSDDNFFERVYAVVRQIPYGKVTSYALLQSFRHSLDPLEWLGHECVSYQVMFQHRVVNRNGLLTGKLHFDGTNLMQQLLLENEACCC